MLYTIRNHKVEGVLAIIVGIGMITIPANFLLNIFAGILGLGLILLGLFTLTLNMASAGFLRYYYLAMGLVLMAMGILLWIYDLDYFASICGVLLIFDFVFKLCITKTKKEYWRTNLWRLILGVVLICLGFVWLAQVLLYIGGGLLIAFGIYKVIFVKNIKVNLAKEAEPLRSKGISEATIDVDFEKVDKK